MKVYLGEMYPVPQRLATWAVFYLSFVTFLARLHGLSPPLLSLYATSGILAIFFFGLILRLMDELKDRDVDRELFRDRPLPSGRVREGDIKISLAAAMGCFLLVNAWRGKVFVMALALLGYSLLMFKFFFIPGILRRYLLLNLATHNPVTALMLLLVVFIFSAEQGLPLGQIKWPATFLLIAMYWSMLFAWEIARKIRSREEENAYVTYSQILGRKGAVLVAAGAQTVTFLVGLYLYRRLSLSPVFPILLAVAYGRVVWAYGRFLVHPNAVTSKLKPVAEQYLLTVLLARLLDYLVHG
jgi:4-hydroxybenzoate polyprenyltransferase